MLDKQWARLQDGEGMQHPIPEYYFSEKGEDCFSSEKAVHVFTDVYTNTARKDSQIFWPFASMSFL